MRCTPEQSQGVLKLRVVAEGQQGDWRSSHQVIRLSCNGVVTAAIAIRQLRWIFYLFFLMQQATPPSCSVVVVRSQHNSEYCCTNPTWCIFSKFGTTQHYKIIHLILTKQLRGQYCRFFFLEKKNLIHGGLAEPGQTWKRKRKAKMCGWIHSHTNLRQTLHGTWSWNPKFYTPGVLSHSV